ncbi:MAG TPA: DUF4956 domain-containing protein [Clostridiales bacterium]|jgi:uncharacterized membrane protein YhiD involved in acid resistance|nr:DUF4956 domain-containing protein [Clostridiales bacterium]HCG36696.1 DUF4956 domain-containing protein [Clostridiales bacterium]
MNKIAHAIKDQFGTELVKNLSMSRIVLSLVIAFGLGLFIFFIYRVTYSGVLYHRTFAFSLVMLSMITAVVIMTISSNLALSLGMVGALSIVRFRTAVKDVNDTVFMFWAITAGIMTGTGYYFISSLSTLTLGLLYYLLVFFGFKSQKSLYLLVIRYDKSAANKINGLIHTLPRNKVKSKTASSGGIELALEIKLSDESLSLVDKMEEQEGIRSVSLLSYTGETTR